MCTAPAEARTRSVATPRQPRQSSTTSPSAGFGMLGFPCSPISPLSCAYLLPFLRDLAAVRRVLPCFPKPGTCFRSSRLEGWHPNVLIVRLKAFVAAEYLLSVWPGHDGGLAPVILRLRCLRGADSTQGSFGQSPASHNSWSAECCALVSRRDRLKVLDHALRLLPLSSANERSRRPVIVLPGCTACIAVERLLKYNRLIGYINVL